RGCCPSSSGILTTTGEGSRAGGGPGGGRARHVPGRRRGRAPLQRVDRAAGCSTGPVIGPSPSRGKAPAATAPRDEAPGSADVTVFAGGRTAVHGGSTVRVWTTTSPAWPPYRRNTGRGTCGAHS